MRGCIELDAAIEMILLADMQAIAMACSLILPGGIRCFNLIGSDFKQMMNMLCDKLQSHTHWHYTSVKHERYLVTQGPGLNGV